MKRKIIAQAEDPKGEQYAFCWLPQRKDFVHWIVNDNQEYYLGRYFPHLEQALEDFEYRIQADDDRTEIDWKIPAKEWNECQIRLFYALEDKEVSNNERKD